MIDLLLIDNNDSFTYNIVNLIKSNFEDVNMEVINHSCIDINTLHRYDKIIFSPGPSLPKDYPIMKQVLDKYADIKSILGICLGHQAICEYYGADIKHIGRVVHGEPSLIKCADNSVLFKELDNCIVGRYHSWAAYNIPAELKIVAVDSKNCEVMAVEHMSKKIYGVQFHPESYITNCGIGIIKNFIYAL